MRLSDISRTTPPCSSTQRFAQERRNLSRMRMLAYNRLSPCLLISHSMQSFPSGHSANSFAAAVFLTLYMNAKLKTIGDHASHYWTFLLTITPLVLASVLAALMYITHVGWSRQVYSKSLLTWHFLRTATSREGSLLWYGPRTRHWHRILSFRLRRRFRFSVQPYSPPTFRCEDSVLIPQS